MKNIKNISSTLLSSHEYENADIAKGRERNLSQSEPVIELIKEREK
jgi:hypothetical protein